MTRQRKGPRSEINWSTIHMKPDTEKNRAMAVVNLIIKPQFPSGRQLSLPFKVYARMVQDLHAPTGVSGYRDKMAHRRIAAEWLLNNPWPLSMMGIEQEWALNKFKQAGIDIRSYL